MSDLIDDPEGAGNSPEFTVAELSGAIKRVIEGEFAHVRVRGEIGRVSRPRSGHIYLDLKDDRAVISGVIWKGVATRLATQPEEGLEVVATGRLTTFGGQSKYQIVIDDIKPAGVGALMALLEKRKAQLQAEGLFDASRKAPLPYLPEIIGVVTSPSGAVIRDILHRLRDRFPRKVLIWPVAVQGEKCAPEVTRAIEGFNRMTPGGGMPRPDLLIVARGGGSIEDLWGFNEESVARATAASDIPLISAVGHETDTTLIDYVSDWRAPTPTAAAEKAVPVRLDLIGWVEDQGARMSRAMAQRVEQRGQRLRDLARAMPRADTLLDAPRQKLDLWDERLPNALRRMVDRRRVQLSEKSASLRPSLLRRAVDAKSDRVRNLAGRLSPLPIRADIDRKSRDLTSVSQRLDAVMAARLDQRKERLDGLERLRTTLGYQATLSRGYAVIRGDGAVVTTAKAAAGVKDIEIEFADGRFGVNASETKAAEKPAAKPKSKPKKTPPDQGSLF